MAGLNNSKPHNDPSSLESLPGASFLASLRESNLSEVLQDIGEMGIDSALEEGILKKVPILEWIVSLRSVVIAVRDYFLLKKVIRFLDDLDGIPQSERDDFVAKIEEDSQHADRVAEALIQYLDRYDHVDKAGLLAKVFTAYGRGQIDLNEFMRLASSIDRAFIRDLKLLLEYYEAEDTKDIRITTTKRNLFSSDLSDFYVLTHQEMRSGGFEHPQVYHFSPLASKLAEIVLGDSFQDGRW